jgi:hypothetical protein
VSCREVNRPSYSYQTLAHFRLVLFIYFFFKKKILFHIYFFVLNLPFRKRRHNALHSAGRFVRLLPTVNHQHHHHSPFAE